MFVEIVRLFVVFLATAGGYAIGDGGPNDDGSGAILGATLGACVGYVAGGLVGRLLGQVMRSTEHRIEQTPAPRLFAGAVGGLAFGGLAGVVGIPVVLLLPSQAGWAVLGLVVWIGAYWGFSLGSRKSDELLALAGLSTRPLVRATPLGALVEQDAIILDTSAVIDGRLLSLARAGFITDDLLVPQFVLDELQTIADAQEPTRRRRGRRALELLEALRHFPGVEVHVLDDEVPEYDEVDAKLVALAKRLSARLLTVDGALQKVAEVQGVRCLSLHRLSDSVRPVHVPGEVIRLPIAKEGREPGQGVGYLDDGTMVVVADATELVGQEVNVRITSNVQTSVGRMLFASLAG
ncbi:MAG TPA: PIN domain-containing protein [Acidimicrobiales bacterium]|nr:PIN domain-containing protein [Acidimicrobiales bacterium]